MPNLAAEAAVAINGSAARRILRNDSGDGNTRILFIADSEILVFFQPGVYNPVPYISRSLNFELFFFFKLGVGNILEGGYHCRRDGIGFIEGMRYRTGLSPVSSPSNVSYNWTPRVSFDEARLSKTSLKLASTLRRLDPAASNPDAAVASSKL